MSELKGQIERELWEKGFNLAGVDEVGRGCLAGPVYAATVALDYEALQRLDAGTKKLIRDSKTLSAKQRQKIRPTIEGICLKYSVAQASVREIEEHGIVRANFLAMARSFEGFQSTCSLLLIDGNQINPLISVPQKSIIGGDGLCFAIAAASILAKEERDSYMRQAATEFPVYAFQDNVGYGTRSHLNALAVYGISPLHRRNFAPIARYIEEHGANA